MRNIILHLAFDGTQYHGWQVQENAVAVQQVVQDAIEIIFGSRLALTGCSRTDSGVHANDYVCNFLTDKPIECEIIKRALNANLPRDIVVTACRQVDEGFHVRYCATGKEYIYKIWNAPVRNPFCLGFAMFYPKKLDVELLEAAAQKFCGTFDFVAFQSYRAKSHHRPSEGEPLGDTVRTIFEAHVTRDGDMLEFCVHGDGFLYNMVRIMMGTLLSVAQGKIELCNIGDIIASHDRNRAGPTAPACGLYLNRVFYGG